MSRAWLAKFETGHPTASVEQVFFVLYALGLAIEVSTPKMTDAEAKVLAALAARKRS